MKQNSLRAISCLIQWIIAIVGGFALGLILLMALFLSSCRSSSGAIPEVMVSTESVTASDTVGHRSSAKIIEQIRVESRTLERILDSVAPRVDSANRLVGTDRWRIIERRVADRETVGRLEAVIDSLKAVSRKKEILRVPYPVEKRVEVERKLRWYEKTLISIGIMNLVILAISLIVHAKEKIIRR